MEQVWLPSLAEILNIDLGDDVGIGPFLARYSDMAGSWGAKVLVSVSRSGGALAAAVLSLFLVPILTFYLLRDWDRILARLGALIPSAQRDTVVRLARETDEVLDGDAEVASAAHEFAAILPEERAGLGSAP